MKITKLSKPTIAQDYVNSLSKQHFCKTKIAYSKANGFDKDFLQLNEKLTATIFPYSQNLFITILLPKPGFILSQAAILSNA